MSVSQVIVLHMAASASTYRAGNHDQLLNELLPSTNTA